MREVPLGARTRRSILYRALASHAGVGWRVDHSLAIVEQCDGFPGGSFGSLPNRFKTRVRGR